MSYIKIEWSGFWDFPDGNYSFGSKIGQPMSGVFDPKYIDLNDVSALTYSIDPGKIGIPKSPDFSFSLINEDPETGEELFPFDYINTIGRTEEYGGYLQDFGDLFIRASIPLLGDRLIFKGVLKDFRYSVYNRRVIISCTDFVGGIKDSSLSMLSAMDFGTLKVNLQSNSNNTSYILQNDLGLPQSSMKDLKGDEVKIQRLTLDGGDTFDGIIDVAKQALGTLGTFGDAPSSGDFQTLMRAAYSSIQDSVMLEASKSIFLQRNNLDSELKASNLIGQGESPGYIGEIKLETSYENGFVKINNTTLITKYRYRFYLVYVGFWDGLNLDVIHCFTKNEVDVIHHFNGNSISYIKDNKTVIVERGRFTKEGNKQEDIYIENGDEVTLSIIDWRRTDGSTNESRNMSVITDKDFVSVGGEIIDINGSLFLGGILYAPDGSGALLPQNKAYFNSFVSTLKALNSYFEYHYFDSSRAEPLFDYSESIPELHQYCFLSDIVHYGWADKGIAEIIVNCALQTSCYLYSTEDGSIKFKSRNILYFDSSDSRKLYREFLTLRSGNEYSYGNKYYSISFKDLLEVNNLESQIQFEKVLSSSGEVSRTNIKPRKLEIGNYRTSDLGVPDSNESFDEEPPLLRLSPITNDIGVPPYYFIQDYLEQGVSFAKSINNPSELFMADLDVLFDLSKGYNEVKIGDILVDGDSNQEGLEKLYLVKSITYNPSRMRNESCAFGVELLNVGLVNEVYYGLNISVVTNEDRS